MTDINRLLASLKRRSAHAKDFGDDATFVKLEDLDALVATIEKSKEESGCPSGVDLQDWVKMLVSELSVVEEIHNSAVFITDELYDASPKEVQSIIRSLACMKMPAYARLVAGIKADVWMEAKGFTKSMLASDSVDHLDFLFDGKIQQLREGGRQMSHAIDAHLTDEVINAAFENTYFGRDDFRTILAETVMKRAAGYHSGYTATFICIRLGLLGKHDRPTKLGLTFAFHHYYRQSVRDALMPKQERAA